MLELLKKTFSEFSDDDAPTMAAALAYYTVFALPPLLILLMMILGFFLDPSDLQGRIQDQMGNLIGPQAAEEVQAMIESADRPGTGGLLATLLSIAALLFSATGTFAQLQNALNKAWEVQPNPNQSKLTMVKSFALKRFFSLGMILVVAFLFLVSLALTTVLNVIGEQLSGLLPGGIGVGVVWVLNFALQFAVITLLFAAIYKVLPDADIAWENVWLGAAVTTVLFILGKVALGFYIGSSNPGEAFGAAGSLAVILVWVYYSAMIVLLGAEFTQVWASRDGTDIPPSEGAVRVVEEKTFLDKNRNEVTIEEDTPASREKRP